MARQVLPIVGAIAGGLIAGPTGAQAGFALGSLIGNAVDPLEVQGNKVGDNPLQTASEGGARAIVFGKGCIRATCILERGNRIVRKQREQSGKGGGPVTINERVFWTFAIGLGEDLIGGAILRVWEGEKLVYDVTPGSAIPEESAQFAEKFRFYDGSETQLPDPDLETIHGVGEAPYYRGTAYVVFPNFDLTDYREAIPVYRWEVSKAIAVEQPGTILASGLVTGLDYRMSTSVNGSSWSSAFDPEIGTAYLQALSDPRFVAFNNDSAWYSDDYGDEWTEADSSVFSGVGVYLSSYRDGVLLIGASNSGVYRSVDEGLSYSLVSASGLRVDAIQFTSDETVVGVWSSDFFFQKSSNAGASWSIGGAHLLSGGDGFCQDFHLGQAIFGGSHRYNFTPYIVFTSTGDSHTAYEFTSSGGSKVSAIAANNDPANPVIVACTNNDEVYYNTGSGWVLSAFSPPDSVKAAVWNGAVFVIAGGTMGNGFIAYSANGIDWTSAAQPLTESIYSIAAQDPVVPEISGQSILLSSVIASIHERCGHSISDYDLADVTDLIAGAVFEQSLTGSEAINSLIGPYFADASEYDGAIHYLKRGAPVVRTLTYDDLTEEPDETQRQNAIEYPRKLHFFFQSSVTAYAATKATSSRSSPDLNTVKGEVSVASPITFDGPDEPAQIAAKLHKVNWTDAEGEIEWEVTDEQLDLVPTDCVGLSLRGRVTRARITHIEDTPGRRKLKMRVDRQSAYTSDVTGIPLPTPTPPQPSILSPTINAYMDIPALLDSHDLASPVYYDGMSGQTDVWPGAVLQRSLDDGSTWTNVTATTLNAIMGVLQETVNSASPYYTDTTNQVVVRLYMDDEIESITNTAFLSEQGAFALSWEDSGQRQWEIMQYRDAQQDSNGDWVLTTLHRGRLNTEAVEHPPGSTFVLLDTAVRLVTAQSAWINTELTHRAVTNGLSPESAAQDTEPFTAQSQTEWPVAHLFLDQDSAGDTTANLVPRNRFGTSLNPIRSINWTGYRWTVTDGSNTINRDGTSETEVFDTSGWGTVTVTVSQLNRITGPGPSVSESIP